MSCAARPAWSFCFLNHSPPFSWGLHQSPGFDFSSKLLFPFLPYLLPSTPLSICQVCLSQRSGWGWEASLNEGSFLPSELLLHTTLFPFPCLVVQAVTIPSYSMSSLMGHWYPITQGSVTITFKRKLCPTPNLAWLLSHNGHLCQRAQIFSLVQCTLVFLNRNCIYS